MTIRKYKIRCAKCGKKFSSNSRYYVYVEGYPFEVNQLHKKCAEKEEAEQKEILIKRQKVLDAFIYSKIQI